MASRGSSSEGAEASASRLGGRRFAVLWAVFAVLSLAVYAPALRGAFVSDDHGYLLSNPYVAELSVSNLAAILDPFGPVAQHTANWAPVHILLHALEWQVFGTSVLGYHVVNVLLHALVSALLVPLFTGAGVPLAGAVAGGLFFLLHPANVEAVAWISQLKSVAALALAVGALLAHPRRPALGAVLFGLALLTKALAVFALPVALLLALARRRTGGLASTQPQRLAWLAVWALLLALIALPELLQFGRSGERNLPLHPDFWVNARTLFAIGARYLAMAATSYGVSAFHQPPPALSALDPWWLAALVTGAAIAGRALTTLLRLRSEGAFWVWAAVAYAPVCQVFAFLYPMGDRYLYFVLPGLIGAALLAGDDVRRRLADAGSERALQRVGMVAAATALTVFAVRSAERAAVWRSETMLMLDAASHYPSGTSASLLRARSAAQNGDVEATVTALRTAAESGFDRFMDLDVDPGLAPVREDPRFRACVRDLAGHWIETVRARGDSNQIELRVLAQAHGVRGEWAEAVVALERALAQGGPATDAVRRDLVRARAQQAAGAELRP